MLDSKTKDLCRICARELYGNQRRWIFNPTAKLSLQVLLSHAVGRQLSRDGRREFACSKCAFMLDRMYRFDTVIARVEALSIERMHKLLLEKERLRQCIGGLYRKNNPEEIESEMVKSTAEASLVDTPAPSDAKYSSLLEEDLTYSVYECWAEHGTGPHQQAAHHHQHQCHQCHVESEASTAQRSRKCRGCTTLRVADSDYEAICKVPRKVGRSTSCGPSTRYSVSNLASTEETCAESEAQEPAAQSSSLTEISQTVETAEEENVSLSQASSIESLDATGDVSQPCSLVHSDLLQRPMEEEKVMTQSSSTEQSPNLGLELTLSLIKSFECRPVRVFRGSRLPVPIKPVPPHQTPQATDCPFSLQPADLVPLSVQQELQLDLAEIEALWLDDYVPCGPLGFQEKLIAEQQVQLVQYETAAGQCVTELQKAQLQVQSLQTKIRESEANNKELQQRLGVIEAELLSLRETARGQERTIQTLTDSLGTKDSTIADLHQLTEEQKQLLISLKQQNQKHQLQNLQTSTTAPSPLQAELLELQASLFSTQLELQSVQRTQRQAQRREEELTRTNQRLHDDLQDEQRHHREAEKHNQELLMALQRVRSDLEHMEEKWKEGEGEKQREVEEREGSIRELKARLQHKERLLHDYTELLDGQKEAGGNRDILIHKLKLRIQERDRALERAVDERFVCVEQKEAEVRKLQLLLREKERDLQKVRCVLSNNEETITEFTAALLSKVPLSSSEVMEKLKTRLQVKERLFQELLMEHSHQIQEHHTHLQELLNTMHTRERCNKDAAERAGQVMQEQAARLQELRRQVVAAGSRSSSTSEPPEDVQLLREELQLALSKQSEAQRELSILRATLANNQKQLQSRTAQLSVLNHTSKPECPVSMETEQTASSHTDTGDSTSDVEEEEDDGASEFTESTEEDEHCRVTAQALTNTQSYEQISQSPAEVDGPGLAEVKLLVEQKQVVERELWELKAQLEKAGFTSISQMRKALLSLRSKNEELRNSVRTNEAEEETHRPSDEQRGRGVQWQPESCEGKKRSSGVLCLDPGAQAVQQKLPQRLLVSKSTIQTPAERLRDYREQLMETPVKHDSKQVQVDLQDLGYETCGRSENEAERDDTSSPEFDDLELCTSLSCRDGASQWWSGLGAGSRAGGDVASLQQKVEDLHIQLSRSQALVLSLQSRLQDATPNPTPRKLNRDDGELRELVTRVSSLEEQLRKGKGQSEEEEEEAKSTTRTGKFDTLIQAQARELSHLRQRMREGRSVCHILTQHLGDTTKSFEELLRDNDIDYYMGQSFRDQLAQSSALAQRVGAKISSRDYSEEADDRTGHELLAIRVTQRQQHHASCSGHVMVESVQPGTGVDGHSVSQSQGHAGRHTGRGAMAPLWRSMLSKSSALYRNSLFSFSLWESRVQERELVLLRGQVERERRALQLHVQKLSKELQQKDKLIESLRFKLQQQQQHGVAPLTSSPSLSGDADQLERVSIIMDEQGSTNEDLDLCSELDTVSEFGQEDVADDSLPPEPSHPYTYNPPSVASSHGHQSSSTCPSMHCSPPRLRDGQIHTELSSAPLPQNPQCLSAQMALPPFDPHTQHLRPRSSITGGFSLAEVHQELQRLQRQLANSFSGAQVKPLPGAFQVPDRTDFHLPSQHAFQQSSFTSLHASPNILYGAEQKREHAYNNVSSSSSGYQPGARHTGTDLMEEHLREIRSLHQRLEDSIQTNERLRRQLAQRLGSRIQDGGLILQSPHCLFLSSGEMINSVLLQTSTSKGLDSVSQLSNEVRVLKEENQALQRQLQQASRDGMEQAEQMRDAVLLEHTRLKQGGAGSGKVGGEFQAAASTAALQHEVNVLQQQLSESGRLVHALQGELQILQRLRGATKNDSEDSPCSPPVQDAGVLNPASSAKTRHEGEVPADAFACRTGRHVVGHWDDFSALQQQLLEGKVLICKMEAALQSSVEINLHEGRESSMLTNTKTLKQILEEMLSVLRMFWRAALPSSEITTSQHQKEQTLTEEVVSLKHKLAEQEKALRDTLETLRDVNRTKDSMEQFIFSQLSRTRDVLKKARTNLEKNELRINSLGCSFSPPSPQSFSFTPPWATRGEISKTGRSSCPGPRIVTAAGNHPHTRVSWAGQYPLQMFSSDARSALHTAAPIPS
ncbi:hypothetical protein QTP86_031335 [Hemibagrus guttatus]|nr:hypothetical protein QTP86_031335 [Hemibagrus guttatus]